MVKRTCFKVQLSPIIKKDRLACCNDNWCGGNRGCGGNHIVGGDGGSTRSSGSCGESGGGSIVFFLLFINVYLKKYVFALP